MRKSPVSGWSHAATATGCTKSGPRAGLPHQHRAERRLPDQQRRCRQEPDLYRDDPRSRQVHRATLRMTTWPSGGHRADGLRFAPSLAQWKTVVRAFTGLSPRRGRVPLSSPPSEVPVGWMISYGPDHDRHARRAKSSRSISRGTPGSSPSACPSSCHWSRAAPRRDRHDPDRRHWQIMQLIFAVLHPGKIFPEPPAAASRPTRPRPRRPADRPQKWLPTWAPIPRKPVPAQFYGVFFGHGSDRAIWF